MITLGAVPYPSLARRSGVWLASSWVMASQNHQSATRAGRSSGMGLCHNRDFPYSLARLRRRAVSRHCTAPPPRCANYFSDYSSRCSGLEGPFGASKGLICPQPGPVFPSGRRASPCLPTPGASFSDVSGRHDGAMPGTVRSRWIRSRMAAKSLRGTATSAIWKNTYFE